MNKEEPRVVQSSGRRRVSKPNRAKRPRQQNVALIVVIVGIALVIVGLIVIPQLQAANTPQAVGTIVPLTPAVHPQASGTAMGNPNAKVRIDIYEDFQCSSCLQFFKSVEPQLIKNEITAGTVYYVFHHYLLIDTNSPGQESHKAANASMCASDQGRFWDYHDMLFNNWTGENVGDFTDVRLKAFAQTLGLDMTQFNTCYSANSDKAKIDADMAQAAKLGVSGTPTVFVNGVEVIPGYIPTYEQIQQAIAAVKIKYSGVFFLFMRCAAPHKQEKHSHFSQVGIYACAARINTHFFNL